MMDQQLKVLVSTLRPPWRKRMLILDACPLTSICVLWHIDTHVYKQQINKCMSFHCFLK